MCLDRDSFNYILDTVRDQIVLTLANAKPDPTPPYWQLGLTIYWLATGCRCEILTALFSLSVPSVNEFFNKIFWILVGTLYDQYVRLPETEAEWEGEVKGFLENYELRVDVCDGSHVYVNSNLKNCFNFRKTLLSDKPWIGGFQQALPLRSSWGSWKHSWWQTIKVIFDIYRILDGDMPDKVIRLGDFEEISRHKQLKYFNKIFVKQG